MCNTVSVSAPIEHTLRGGWTAEPHPLPAHALRWLRSRIGPTDRTPADPTHVVARSALPADAQAAPPECAKPEKLETEMSESTYGALQASMELLSKKKYDEAEKLQAEYEIVKVQLAPVELPKPVAKKNDAIIVPGMVFEGSGENRGGGALHKLTGVKLKMSSSYHPETDGARERTNKTVNQCMRYYVDRNHKGWVRALPRVRFHIMNTVNASTGCPPFSYTPGVRLAYCPPSFLALEPQRSMKPHALAHSYRSSSTT